MEWASMELGHYNSRLLCGISEKCAPKSLPCRLSNACIYCILRIFKESTARRRLIFPLKRALPVRFENLQTDSPPLIRSIISRVPPLGTVVACHGGVHCTINHRAAFGKYFGITAEFLAAYSNYECLSFPFAAV
jgi:hypothetical protein